MESLCRRRVLSEGQELPNYLKFKILEDGSVTIACGNSAAGRADSVLYSTSQGRSWAKFVIGNNYNWTINVQRGDEILFKGYGKWASNSIDDSYSIHFTSTCRFDVSGNILSLVYGDNFEGKTSMPAFDTVYQGFQNLFINSKVVSAKDLLLPVVSLSEEFYLNMFSGCSSLTEAPSLPATTLGKYCYRNMFYGCSSLTEAPSLPSYNLAEGCYSYMFSGCSSLTEIPVLKAVKMKRKCFNYMFENCTSLTSALIPGVIISSVNMYHEDYAENCFSQMFKGCSNLNYIKALFSVELSQANTYLNGWVDGVAASGTFVKRDGTNWQTGVSGIPSGWTVQIAS